MTKKYNTGRQLGAGVKLARKQVGASFMSVFAVLAVAIFLGLSAFKLGPHYMEYLTISKIAEEVTQNDELMKGSKSKVMKQIDQSYHTNSIWDLKATDTVELKKDGAKGYLVTVNYEKRTPLFANIEVVTVFQKAVNAD